MLGSRHFQGSAIDLYLGDITEFCSDVIVTACNPDLSPMSPQDKSILSTSTNVSFSDSKQTELSHVCTIEKGHLPAAELILLKGVNFDTHFEDAIVNTLNYARQQNLRHLSFPFWSSKEDLEKYANKFFNIIKTYLLKNSGPELRITVVLNSKDDYFNFQDEMFKIFPEETT